VASIKASDVKALRDKTGAGMMDCKRALSDAEGDLEKASELLRERGLAKAGKRAGRATSEGAIGIAMEGGRAGIVELGCETDFVAKTDDFQQLAQEVAAVMSGIDDAEDVEQLLAAPLGDGSVADRITATISRVGENIELKRVARIRVEDGITGGYTHIGGKLGVIVGVRAASGDERVQALARDLAMHVAAADPTPIGVDRSEVSAELIEKERDLLRREALQSGKPEKVIDRIVDGRVNKYYAENCLVEQAFVKDPDTSVGDMLKQVAGAIGGEVSVCAFRRFKLGETSES
jgi:elongation factor Ts